MSGTQPPANWYPDPEDPSQQRYWDGAAWTDHRAPLGPSQTAQTLNKAGNDLADGIAGAFSSAETWWRQQQTPRALTFADVAGRWRDDLPRRPFDREASLVVAAADIDPVRRVFADARVDITGTGSTYDAPCRLVPNPWNPAAPNDVAVLVGQHQVGLLPPDVADEYRAALVALSQRQLLAVGEVTLAATWTGTEVTASATARLPQVAALA